MTNLGAIKMQISGQGLPPPHWQRIEARKKLEKAVVDSDPTNAVASRAHMKKRRAPTHRAFVVEVDITPSIPLSSIPLTSLPTSQDKKTTHSLRVMSYNLRAFFDRYTERLPTIKEVLLDKQPAILAMQESMVSGAGLESDIQNILNELCKTDGESYKTLSEPSIVTSLKTVSILEIRGYSTAVAIIFCIIINIQLLLLSIPIISNLLNYLPLTLFRFKMSGFIIVEKSGHFKSETG